MHFVCLDAFTIPLNNPTNIFLVNPKIILYNVAFIKHLWISKISLVSIGLKSIEKSFTLSFNPFFTIFHIINREII